MKKQINSRGIKFGFEANVPFGKIKIRLRVKIHFRKIENRIRSKNPFPRDDKNGFEAKFRFRMIQAASGKAKKPSSEAKSQVRE